jgi:hypothetical protein
LLRNQCFNLTDFGDITGNSSSKKDAILTALLHTDSDKSYPDILTIAKAFFKAIGFKTVYQTVTAGIIFYSTKPIFANISGTEKANKTI